MLALKKGETISLYRYSNVIYVLSVVICFCLLNACSVVNGTTTEAEPNFAPENIIQSCIEKCPDQVSEKDIQRKKKYHKQSFKCGSEFISLFLIAMANFCVCVSK